ncbi:unnamed protein product [Acanthoscelides obtectus]|uniref:t-SNARE coiled-coil homology domain-containing protein n=1 Tax=Acanthoscelides obtectus TaxID=200917 RepID=A0A9P0P929_ACAOB|nr:unnamed protein product [Acanthoscelides obtectus]CAK1662353.1 hypothetical protein AOBTE_LOCUS23102 [Acanthoscelides obtectus]
MANIIPSNSSKQPMKVLEVPLNKFSDEVVPHHQNVFEQYKGGIQKLVALNNTKQLKKEIKEKKRTVKQLRDLMYELDTLRTQVEDEDLDKFDIKTLSLRKIIINLINGYTELEKSAEKLIQAEEIKITSEKENCNPFEGASQLQLQENLNDLKLKQHREQLARVENINKDVEDLHEIYRDLHGMVETQATHVDQVEESVESTQKNVEGGLKHLVNAHKRFSGWHAWWPGRPGGGTQSRRSSGDRLRHRWIHWWEAIW